VDCHRCAQISPALAWCDEACIFCWRPMEWMKRTSFGDAEIDSPDEIIEGCVKERKKLISGFGHFRDLNKGRFDESFEKFPSHWAISLSGEPTIYPKLAELVLKLKANPEVKTVFIVTNGQNPKALSKLAMEDALPTQLYLSLSAPDKETFMKVNRSVHKDGWERLNETIGIFPALKCRRAIRLTIIKGVNDSDAALPGYAGLIERSETDFVEIKSYMALGFSRKRLGKSNMLEHGEVEKFSEKLAKMLPGYSIRSDDEASRIVLLKRKDSKYGDIIRKQEK
jgi:tRNA wybutosine-synthesizing protein 1